jgi:hypothetical protein
MAGWTITQGGNTINVNAISPEFERVGPGGVAFMSEGGTFPAVFYPDSGSYEKFSLRFWTLNKTDHDKAVTIFGSKAAITTTDHYGVTRTVRVVGNYKKEQVKASPTSTDVGLGFAVRHLYEWNVDVVQVS